MRLYVASYIADLGLEDGVFGSSIGVYHDVDSAKKATISALHQIMKDYEDDYPKDSFEIDDTYSLDHHILVVGDEDKGAWISGTIIVATIKAFDVK